MTFDTIEQWREEYRTLMKCRDALSGQDLGRAYHAQKPHFANYVESVVAKYGMERVNMVLGHTVRCKSWDGRFDPGVKVWANRQTTFAQPPRNHPDSIFRTYDDLSCNAHSVILNFVCRHVMDMEKQSVKTQPQNMNYEVKPHEKKRTLHHSASEQR